MTAFPLSAGAALAFLIAFGGLAAPAARAADQKMLVSPPATANEGGGQIIQLPHGYARYQPDADQGGGQAPHGGVTVEPAPRPSDSDDGVQTPPLPMSAFEEPSPARPLPASDPCLEEEQALAQRLMELRGVHVDPGSALLAEQQFDVPFSPYVALSMFGRPMPLIGGTFLANVLSWDIRSQELTGELAQCLNEQR